MCKCSQRVFPVDEWFCSFMTIQRMTMQALPVDACFDGDAWPRGMGTCHKPRRSRKRKTNGIFYRFLTSLTPGPPRHLSFLY